MASTPTPPAPSQVRLTITVTPEVHAAFKRLADAGSMSISRAMGDWLADTLEAAELMALKMEEARAAPKRVIREMHAYALGLVDETGAMLNQITRAGAEARQGRARGPRTDRAGLGAVLAAGVASVPPVGNTGGKVPQKQSKGGGGRA